MYKLIDYLTSDPTGRLLAGFIVVLLVLTISMTVAGRLTKNGRTDQAFRQLNGRIRNLWSVVLVFSIAMLTAGLGTLLVFAACSFLLLREFVTITPTRKADHRALFWGFFVILPLQYIVLGWNWYGLFVILIPVYGFLFVPIRIAAGNDSERFLERAGRIQWALMLCVYCVSYAPALLRLSLSGPSGMGARLLLFLCIVVQVNDAVHEFVDNLWGRHFLAPHMKSKRSIEGLVAGVLVGVGIGTVMAGFVPLSFAQAVLLATVICLTGSAGQMCLSDIRNERGREGVVIVYRNQDMMGRFISLCFAAPVFFHIVRFTLGASDIQLF